MSSTTEYGSFFNDIPQENLVFVEKLGLIMDRIDAILQSKKMTRTDLAFNLDKKPSEISKWFNSPHNLTLKSITKIETVLACTLIEVPEIDELFSNSEGELPNYADLNKKDSKPKKPAKSIQNSEEDGKLIYFPFAA
jgi:transcriptional regulator with XRE-family HTH domain